MFSKRKLKRVLLKPLRPLCRRACEHLVFVPPGHYYSPIPSDEDFRLARSKTNTSHAEIDLRVSSQLELLECISQYYASIPDFPYQKGDRFRFFYDNHYFSYADTTILVCLLQHIKPKRIIDVGGGVSTRLLLDINDTIFSNNPIELVVIEPNADRLIGMFSSNDKVQVIIEKVQNVDLDLFSQLEAGDILFLDSTHVSKLGSDVNYVMFEILPKLKPGVVVHVHEVFFPFEYPDNFFLEGKYWNELYLWRAFLMSNTTFGIMLFNSYLEQCHRTLLQQHFPRYFERGNPTLLVQNRGASLWLRKN